MLFNGIYLELSFWFLITECLWLNVPLPESCPTNLTGKPSSNKVPKARLSAVDQSIFFPSATVFALWEKTLSIVLWANIFEGIEFIFSDIFLILSLFTPVTPFLSLPLVGWYLDHVPSNQFNFGL